MKLRNRSFAAPLVVLLLGIACAAACRSAVVRQSRRGSAQSVSPSRPLGRRNSPAPATPGNSSLEIAGLLSNPPLSFEANEGQTDPEVSFLAREPQYTLFLTRAAAVVARPSRSTRSWIEMNLGGARPHPQVAGLARLQQKTNYFIGSHPQRWHTGIPNYREVRYRNAYPGIDVLYYGNPRRLEYDFKVTAGADPSLIRLGFRTARGAAALHEDARGNLLASYQGSVLNLMRPRAYQDIRTKGAVRRRRIPSRYVIVSRGVARLALGAYDRSKPLMIDPVLVYSTYLGGSGGDTANALAVDGSGDVFVTGGTGSTNFPTASPEQKSSGGATDVFVTEINPSGSSLIYSTYIGGTGSDKGTGIAVDSSGNAYVIGSTSSANFPATSGAFSKTYHGNSNSEGFVLKLNSSGSSLGYATYLGGSSGDFAQGIAVDGAGDAYVTGSTQSSDFPVASALQGSLAGGSDAFITEVNPQGSGLVYSTFLGGSAADSGQAIAVDGSGAAYVAGFTFSGNFPTKNPVQGSYAGAGDAFLAKISPGGSALAYSTYLGGTGEERGLGVAVDSAGEAYITGSTQSSDFPATPGAYKMTAAGGADVFLAKLNASGSALVYATLLGGSQNEQGNGVAVDSSGNAYVTGSTSSSDFPVQNPSQAAIGEGACASTCSNAFVSVLNPQGSGLVYSTYLGGSGPDYGQAIAVNSSGDAFVAGTTASSNFPMMSGAYQASYAGAGTSGNAFVAEISPSNSPGLALNPQKMDFGNQGLNVASTAQTVTLTNVGSAQLTISNISTSGDFSQANTCGSSLAPGGGQCTVSVTFTPTQTAAETGTLSITDNAAGSPQQVSLSGTGVTPAPVATFSSTLVNFPSQLIGTSSTPQTVTLTNTGTADLTITKITISGSFTETDNCPSTLSASKSCSINVTFSPTVNTSSSSSSSSSTSTTASNSGALSLTDNASGTAPTVDLNGTALADFSVSSAAPSGPIVVGTGSTTLTVTAASLLSSFSGSITLSCSSEVTCSFSPSSITPGQTSTMTVSGLSSPSTNPVTFTLTGASSDGNQSATSSAAISFEDYVLSATPSLNTVAAGQSAVYTVSVAAVNGFSNPVALSCSSGLPGSSSCTFSPSSVTPGASAVTSTLTITTTAHTKTGAAPPAGRPHAPPGGWGALAWGIILLSLLIGLALVARLTRRREAWLFLALVLAILLAACNLGYYGFVGSNPAPTGSASGVYAVTITGTYTPSSSGSSSSSSSAVSRSTSVNLAVQ
ncbi:MAG: SBBP repeat-containing protein [Terriglobia bacterium]